MNHPIATPKEVIEVLNGLIEICRDGQQGFADASENISQVSWKKFCLEQSLHRANYAGELQQHVQHLGGEPETTGSTTGSIHRAWINLKAGLGGGDEAIMSACETGEDAAVSLYKKALEKNLPNDVQEVVAQQYRAIQLSHDKVKSMRENYVA